MLATKHNSCLYFSQSLSLSLHLYIHCLKKSVGNRKIQRVKELEEAYSQTTHTGPYIQCCMSEKSFNNEVKQFCLFQFHKIFNAPVNSDKAIWLF